MQGCLLPYDHMRNLYQIRKCINMSTAETSVLALVTSHLDNCNSLLGGIPGYLIQKLEKGQNRCTHLSVR